MKIVIPNLRKFKSCPACPLMSRNGATFGDCEVQNETWETWEEQYDHCPVREEEGE